MSPPPVLAVVLLGSWIVMVFAVTNAAGYHQWLAENLSTDADERRE